MMTGFDLCRAAMAVSEVTAPEQSVLTALAIMANEDAQCWPPINGPAGLTGKTKLSERTVQRAVIALENAGHITTKDNPGRGRLYTVHPRHTDATPVSVAPPSDSPNPRQTDTRQSGTPVTLTPTPVSVAPNQPVSTITQEIASPSLGKRARVSASHRLPDDWHSEPAKPGSVAAEIIATWEPGRMERELAKFRDYWTAASGQRARKHDWQAAWRTWITNADSFGARNGTVRNDRSSSSRTNDGWLNALNEASGAGRAHHR